MNLFVCSETKQKEGREMTKVTKKLTMSISINFYLGAWFCRTIHGGTIVYSFMAFLLWLIHPIVFMKASWRSNAFSITGPTREEYVGYWWIPSQMARNAWLWFLLWCQSDPAFEQTLELPGDFRPHDAHVPSMWFAVTIDSNTAKMIAVCF